MDMGAKLTTLEFNLFVYSRSSGRFSMILRWSLCWNSSWRKGSRRLRINMYLLRYIWPVVPSCRCLWDVHGGSSFLLRWALILRAWVRFFNWRSWRMFLRHLNTICWPRSFSFLGVCKGSSSGMVPLAKRALSSSLTDWSWRTLAADFALLRRFIVLADKYLAVEELSVFSVDSLLELEPREDSSVTLAAAFIGLLLIWVSGSNLLSSSSSSDVSKGEIGLFVEAGFLTGPAPTGAVSFIPPVQG